MNNKPKQTDSLKVNSADLFLPASMMGRKLPAPAKGYKSPLKTAAPGTATAINATTNPTPTGVRIFSELWNSLTPFTYSSALLPYLLKIGNLETAWSRDPFMIDGGKNGHVTNFQLGSSEYRIATQHLTRLTARDATFSSKLIKITNVFKGTATEHLVKQLSTSVAWFQNLSEYVSKNYSLTEQGLKGPDGFQESIMYPQIASIVANLQGTPFKRRLLTHVFIMACIHRFGTSFYNKNRVLSYPLQVIGLAPTSSGTPSSKAYAPPSHIDGHPITDYFGVPRGEGKVHRGVDIAAPLGTRLYAPFTGTITKGKDEYNGNWVTIKSPDKGRFKMIHLDSVAPKLSGTVQPGTFLGTVGKTGSVKGKTGVHLHLTYMKPNSRTEVDPLADASMAAMVETIFTPDHET